jgi:hypothetical protein
VARCKDAIGSGVFQLLFFTFQLKKKTAERRQWEWRLPTGIIIILQLQQTRHSNFKKKNWFAQTSHSQWRAAICIFKISNLSLLSLII